MVSCRSIEGAEVSEVARIKNQTGFFSGLANGGLERGLPQLNLASRLDDVVGPLLANVEARPASHQADGG